MSKTVVSRSKRRATNQSAEQARGQVKPHSATIHSGWDNVGKDGQIPFREDANWGHAFAIIAYDEKGFWIQNSWGNDWGKGGLGQISYDNGPGCSFLLTKIKPVSSSN